MTQEQKKEEASVAAKDPKRLKAAWVNLKQEQEASFNRRRVSKTAEAISSVEIVKDAKGNETVKVSTVAGKNIMDKGENGSLFKSMTVKDEKISASRLDALIQAVKEYGFDAVAGALPAEIQRLLKKECEKNGVRMAEAKEKINQSALKYTAQYEREQARQKARENSRKSSDAKADSIQDILDYENRWTKTTQRTQSQVYVAKNKLIDEERKRFETERKSLRQKFNLLQIEEYRKELYGENGKAETIEAKLKDGKALSKEEQALWNKKERYGIQANPEKEVLTMAQKTARQQMTARDYNKQLTAEHREQLLRKKTIMQTKSRAFEMAAEQMQMGIVQGKRVEASVELLRATAYKLMPKRENMTLSNLLVVQKKLNRDKKDLHVAVVEARQAKRAEISEKLHIALQNQMQQGNSIAQIIPDRLMQKQPETGHQSPQRHALTPEMMKQIQDRMRNGR